VDISTLLKGLKASASPMVLGLALLAGPALAQTADTTKPPPSDNTQVQEVIVTGSLIKRTNTETPSPVTVLSIQLLKTSGFDALSSALANVSANGAGTLSNNNSLAFAGGASGVALRGLSVGATLTLVDGHRLAPYPLSDDGERQFTDVQSIPIGAVDSVEIDKDGASSIYGSDAIAGVVNVKLKQQITGFDAMAEGGTSQHGGGTSQHYAVSAGVGDLSTNDYNVFIAAEYRQQDSITLNQRGDEPWAGLNFTSLGGNDLRAGVPTIFNGGLPATITPYLVSPGGAITFLGSGCNVAAMNAGQCAYTIHQALLAPTSNLSVLIGATKDFGDGWQAKLRFSVFDSKGQQSDGGSVFFGPNAYPGASYGGNVSNPVGGTAVPGVGAIANFTLPANYLGSGSAAGSYLEGLIPGIGLPTNSIDSLTYRVALDVTGTVAGWNVTGSLGYSQVDTHVVYSNYLNVDNLFTDLTTFNAAGLPLFNPLGGNSQAVLNNIAPKFGYTATDSLFYAEADGSRKLMDLPGGDLSLALGATVIQKDLNNPGAAPIEAGLVGNTAALTQPFSTYAIGNQTNVAEFAEVEANLFHQLEIDGGLRDDWFDTYGNSLTPKVGVKWRPTNWLALRGTFSNGFRAPAPAEIGKSATIFGLGSAQDPVLCPNGPGGPFPAGTVPAACASEPGYVQTTNKLKPETSTSFTVGAVVQPIPSWSMTVDYYHIVIKNQIISASELPTYFTPASIAANCVRGPDLAIPGVSDGAGGTDTAVPVAGPLSACFAGYVNAQSTETSGLDLQSQYHFRLGDNHSLTARFEWTHLFDYNLTSPSGATFQLAGTHGPSGVSGDTGNPSDRLNASLSYENGPFDATLSGYWIDSFSVTDPSSGGGSQATCAGAWGAGLALAGATVTPANSQFCKVASFTSVNLVLTYKVGHHVTFSFDMDNLFDEKAPLDPETYGGEFTPYNPSLDEDGVIGRYFRFGVDYKM
jgi:iron complex outermembrane receptor protein